LNSVGLKNKIKQQQTQLAKNAKARKEKETG
jgi:hypothetical protein